MAEVLEDICTCKHCGYTGKSSEFHTEKGFIYCNNRVECWVRWDKKNGIKEAGYMQLDDDQELPEDYDDDTDTKRYNEDDWRKDR